MSCISNNFSSFFLDSLNDPSEFAKYLGNGVENNNNNNKGQQPIEEQIFLNGNGNNYHNNHHLNNSNNIINNCENTTQEGILNTSNCIGSSSSNGSSSTGGSSIISNGSSGGGGSGGGTQQIINNITNCIDSTGNNQCFNTNTINIGNCCNNDNNITLTIYNNQNNLENHTSFYHHQNQQNPSQNYQQSHQQQQQQQHQQQHHQNEPNNQINFINNTFDFGKYLKYSEYGEIQPPINNSLMDLDSSQIKIRLNYQQHNQIISNNNNNNNTIQTTATTAPIPTPPVPPPTVNTTPTNINNTINNNNTTINNNNNSIINNNKKKKPKNNLIEIEHFDHDTKHIFDIHNSNESTGTGSSTISEQIRNINTTSSECSDNSNQTNIININNNNNNNNNNNKNASKPLTKFIIKENFDAHPAHKVEEGIFQHMNKLPPKKKETLKQLSVTFTGHMSISEKSIIVENFAKFCEEYGVNDHRPFLTLNQSGMQKAEQIKFARFLGQGLPGFTLFCIYSNFKNLFCTKRFENYSKDSYNLQYILDKTRRFLTSTSADLKNLTPNLYEPNDLSINNSGSVKQENNNIKLLERLTIFENFEVHESHRIEDGIFTHINRLSNKKQELLKQFGIQSNCNVSYYEKQMIIENFVRFCHEYYITDHRPLLDFQRSGLPKMEQIKFARYLGQGLPNLTLYKIYCAFKDLLALNRIEKFITNGYNLDVILKKKKKILQNRMNSAVSKQLAKASKTVKLENPSS